MIMADAETLAKSLTSDSLISFIDALFVSSSSGHQQDSTHSGIPSCRPLLMSLAVDLRAKAALYVDHVVARVIRECCDRPLATVKTIATQYHMASKTLPTTPSVYVAQVCPSEQF